MPRLLDPASSLPSELSLALLAEAAARDTVTARRAALLASLWRAGRCAHRGHRRARLLRPCPAGRVSARHAGLESCPHGGRL